MKKYIAFQEITQAVIFLVLGLLLAGLFFSILNFWFVNGIAGYFQTLENSKIESISNNICKILQEINELGDTHKRLCETTKDENENEVKSKIDNTDIELILTFGGGNYPVAQISQEVWKWDKIKSSIPKSHVESFENQKEEDFENLKEVQQGLWLSIKEWGIWLWLKGRWLE